MGGGEKVRTPLKNHKHIGFLYWSGSPGKLQRYQASIKSWAIVGPPVKRHLMAFRWRADDWPLSVLFGSSLPSPTKKSVVKVGPLWQHFLSHSAYIFLIFCLLPRIDRYITCSGIALTLFRLMDYSIHIDSPFCILRGFQTIFL